MKKSSQLSKGLGLAVLGIVLLGGSGYLMQSRLAFFNHSLLKEGTVIGVTSSKSKGTTYYHPEISFAAEDGMIYTFLSQTGTSSSFDFNEGDKLIVRYLAEDPKTAKINSFLDLWSFPIALLFASSVISCAGGATLYKHFKRKAP